MPNSIIKPLELLSYQLNATHLKNQFSHAFFFHKQWLPTSGNALYIGLPRWRFAHLLVKNLI